MKLENIKKELGSIGNKVVHAFTKGAKTKAVLESEFCALGALDCLNEKINAYNISWSFKADEKFDQIAKEFIKEHGELNKDVFYVFDTDIDANEVGSLKDGASLQFSNNSILTRKSDYFLYKFTKPIVFGVHLHLDFNEELIPLDEDIIMYVIKNNNYEKIVVKQGETFAIPKGIKHAALFSTKNTIKLKWF